MPSIQIRNAILLIMLCIISDTAHAKAHIKLKNPIHKPLSEITTKSSIDSDQPESYFKSVKSLALPSLLKNQPITPSVVNVPSGCFQMGSPESETGRNKDEAQHRACVKGFKLAKNEVTVEEFSKFIEATHFLTDAEKNTYEPGCWSYEKKTDQAWGWRSGASWKHPIQGAYPLKNFPVVCVSYNDVMAYIEWLNAETGHEYRLPSEEEWEYAARAGTTTAHYWGNNSDIACGYANVADNTASGSFKWPEAHHCMDGHYFAATVKSYRANSFNLHDMLGNAWEWVCSKYEDKYSGREKTCLSAKPDDETLISIRGGGWNADATRVRAAHRNWGVAWSRQANLGFRLLRVR
jgi:formylglycine-generating enzyme